MKLREVFGIGARIDSPAYVDRGGLDDKFSRALESDRHVAVHGGSKQGKSWLREKNLDDAKTIQIQCTPASTAMTLLTEALGRLGVSASLSTSSSQQVQGTLEFGASAEVGQLLAKAKASGKFVGGVQTVKTTIDEPIGQTTADLAWVSAVLVASERRLVLEDFHYLEENVQRELAFLMKAMGEYGLFIIAIGVWPQDHLLTYYNGDLEGRVVDIHLTWDDEELSKVLTQGARALGIAFPTQVVGSITSEAFGNVGVVHRLAEQLCLAEGVTESRPMLATTKHIGPGPNLDVARREVAKEMQPRFQNFADNFVRGMRRLKEGLEVYRHLLEAVTTLPEEELLRGVDSAELLRHIGDPEETGIRPSDLTQALDRVDRLQSKINVHPPVITYNRSSRKLFLADRSFLFYRRHTTQQWPWSSDAFQITNDLAIQDPIDMDFDFDGP